MIGSGDLEWGGVEGWWDVEREIGEDEGEEEKGGIRRKIGREY